MNWQVLNVLIGGIATLAIFSFLIKENSVYRFFEHVFIGIAAGLGVVLSIKEFFWPNVLVPMLGLDILTFPDGTTSHPYNSGYLLYLIPMLVGLLYYFIFSSKYSWLAKIVIGISLGASAGISFKGFFAETIPQLTSSFKPLIVIANGSTDWLASFSNCVFVFTLVSVMVYFLFSFKSESKTISKISVSGRYLMMVCFGAFFGSTVMARMALLVERLDFLINSWVPAITKFF